MKDKEIFLLWCWVEYKPITISGFTTRYPTYTTTTLKGAYESEEEYFIDANGNCQVPKYKPKK